MNNINEKNTWYDKSLDQIEKRFETDRNEGLQPENIKRIRRKYGANNIYTSSEAQNNKPLPNDYSVILLIAAVIVAMIFEVPIAAGAIITMIIINYVSAYLTSLKAQKVLSGMTEYSLPTAKVMRDGRLMLLDMRALVPGDLIYLSAGDIVPADCRLCASDGLFVNEGTLTGIQNSVEKRADFEHYAPSLPIDLQKNTVFASTIVTAGNGRAIVVTTGKNVVASRLGKIKPITTHENLKILSKLKKYCSVWSLSMLLLVFIITVVKLFAAKGSDIFDVFLTGISLSAAAMSELYIAFGYIIVGCGIFSAMKRRRDVNVGAIIKNAEKLEELKNLNTIIVPKDGIITSSNCTVEKIYASGKLYSADDIERVDKLRSVVLSGVISTGIYGIGLTSLSQNSRKINSEEEAIINIAQSLSLYNSTIERSYPIIEHIGAGGASKFETTLTRDSDKQYMAVCRGEAESILNSCQYYAKGGRVFSLNSQKRIELLSIAASLTKSSYKVVALATGVTGYNNLARIGSIQSDLTFEGFMAIKEPIQKGLAETISRCKNAGIHVIMTTDKYSENDKYLAMSVGIIDNEKQILTANRADEMSNELLRTNLNLYNMYVGIKNKKLSQIVKMMRDNGERVGLLTGGMNGAILLKQANVGFAQSTTISPRAKRMGIDIRSRGTPAYSKVLGRDSFDSEALKFISDVVVSDTDDKGNGGFSAVISTLEYSRTIYKNLIRMVKYLTTSQLSRIFIILGSLFLGTTVLNPAQIVFSGLIVDLAAILSAAFAKPPHNSLLLKDNAEQNLKNPLSMNIRALLFAMFEALTILLPYPLLLLMNFNISSAEFSTLAFVAFLLNRLVSFTSLSTEKSLFESGTRICTSFVAFIIGVIIFIISMFSINSIGAVFGITRLSLASITTIIISVILTFAINEIYKIILKDSK